MTSGVTTSRDAAEHDDGLGQAAAVVRNEGRRLRDHPLLLAITIAPLLEAVPLRYFGVTPGLAPQLTTLTPFAVFHDVRWVLVFHSSWTAFVLELVAIVVVRSAFHAAVVSAAWPPEVPRPPRAELVLTSVVFVVVALVVVSPAAALTFAGGATSLSWLQLAAIPLFLLVALAISHGGVHAYWWAQLPTGHSLGWAMLTFVVLNLASAALLLGPWWVAWLSAALAGLFNAWAWSAVVGSLARRSRPRLLIPRTLALVVAVFVTAAGVTSWQARAIGRHHAVGAHTRTSGMQIPVLVADGFDSSWDGRRIAKSTDSEFALVRFSYAGVDAHGHPLPYKSGQTHAALGHLVTLMDRQVRDLSARFRQPVRVLGVSEGSLVARSYVQAFPDAPVSDVVLISPLVEPGRVYYPRSGDDGWGVGARAEMGLLASVLRGISGLDLNPDMPFLRSVVDHAPALRAGLLCPAPHARVVAFLPIASGASIPPLGYRPHIPVRVVNGFHGVGYTQALEYLASHRLPHAATGEGTLNRIIRAGATAWMVPELPVTLNRAWAQPVDDRAGCPTTGWPRPSP